MCGLTENSLVTPTPWSLCGYLPCQTSTHLQALSRSDLCATTCQNYQSRDNPQYLSCKRREATCDGVCDSAKCVDESLCNGVMYGMFCYGEYRQTVYVSPALICDGARECTVGRHDEECDKTQNIERCVSGEIYRQRGVKVRVPLYSDIRCGAIQTTDYTRYREREQVARSGIPYCLDYIDQTNCTDSRRVGVSCYIPGYGYSTVSKVMVCGKFRRKFCVDGMDVECVSVDRTCTVHKHQLCDQVEDCESGADEKYPQCLVLTSQVCYRNYRSNKKLNIPAAWLGDGFEDCLDGSDERFQDHICNKSKDKLDMKVLNVSCHDVFICRGKFQQLPTFNRLCRKFDNCGRGEIIWCEKGLDIASVSTSLQTSGNMKHLAYCLRGLDDLQAKFSSCQVQEFNPLKEQVYGIVRRTSATFPQEIVDCSSIFGETYLILSCLGKCKNSTCPITRPVSFTDCPAQYSNRAYTVVGKDRLTFVERRRGDYHNEYFVCGNGMCTDYDKVCNLIDDCGNGADEENCTNSFRCEDEQGLLPLSKKCDGNIDCRDASDECNSDCREKLIHGYFLKGSAWSLGLLAIVFNVFLLKEFGKKAIKCKTADALTDKLLIFLVGLGDLLTGVYLKSIAALDSFYYGNDYCKWQDAWLSSSYCSNLGFLSTFAFQMSLLSLTTHGVIRAVKVYTGRLHQRAQENGFSLKEKLKIFLLVAWVILFSASVAAIPFLTLLEDYFVTGLVYDRNITIFLGQVGKAKHFDVIQSFYGRAKNQTLKWATIDRLTKAMLFTDFGNIESNVSRVQFYGYSKLCTFKHLVSFNDPHKSSTITLHVINIVSFLIIFITYTYANIKILKCTWANLGRQDNSDIKEKKLNRKLTIITVTNFLCWAPFEIMCLLHYLEVIDATRYHYYLTLVVLPINSVINPLIHSKVLKNQVRTFTAYVHRKLPLSKERFISKEPRVVNVWHDSVISNHQEDFVQDRDIELRVFSRPEPRSTGTVESVCNSRFLTNTLQGVKEESSDDDNIGDSFSGESGEVEGSSNAACDVERSSSVTEGMIGATSAVTDEVVQKRQEICESEQEEDVSGVIGRGNENDGEKEGENEGKKEKEEEEGERGGQNEEDEGEIERKRSNSENHGAANEICDVLLSVAPDDRCNSVC